MAATTSNRSYPYPQDSDDYDPDGDIQALAEAIDTDLQAIDDANMTGRPRFVGTFSSVVANNTVVAMTPAAALVNVGSMWSSGSNITIATAGEYDVGVILRYPSQATAAGVRQARIHVNGSEYILGQVPTTSALNASNIIVQVNTRIILAAADVVEFAAFQNSGVSQTLIGNGRGWVERVVQ